jgi:hypothetical protein
MFAGTSGLRFVGELARRLSVWVERRTGEGDVRSRRPSWAQPSSAQLGVLVEMVKEPAGSANALGGEPSEVAEDVNDPDDPPAHWLEMIRKRAPHLLVGRRLRADGPHACAALAPSLGSKLPSAEARPDLDGSSPSPSAANVGPEPPGLSSERGREVEIPRETERVARRNVSWPAAPANGIRPGPALPLVPAQAGARPPSAAATPHDESARTAKGSKRSSVRGPAPAPAPMPGRRGGDPAKAAGLPEPPRPVSNSGLAFPPTAVRNRASDASLEGPRRDVPAKVLAGTDRPAVPSTMTSAASENPREGLGSSASTTQKGERAGRPASWGMPEAHPCPSRESVAAALHQPVVPSTPRQWLVAASWPHLPDEAPPHFAPGEDPSSGAITSPSLNDMAPEWPSLPEEPPPPAARNNTHEREARLMAEQRGRRWKDARF